MLLCKLIFLAIITCCFECITIHRSEAIAFSRNFKSKKHPYNEKEQKLRAGMIGLVSVLFLATPVQPTIAVEPSDTAITGTLETAIIQMSDAAYPVLSSLTDISSLSNKLVKLGDKIPVTKYTSALDKGIDSLLAIPDDKVASFVTTLQSSYDGVSGDSCSASITIPKASIEQWSSLAAVQALDSAKVKSLQEKFKPANQAVPRTTTSGNSICLPATPQGLEKLWIGQTKLTLDVPRPEARAFVSSASTALQSVPGNEFLKIYPEAKKVFTTNVSRKTSMQFESNAKALEKAIQNDNRFIQRGL